MYKSLYSQVYTDTVAVKENNGRFSWEHGEWKFKVKDVYLKDGKAYRPDIYKENGLLVLDLDKGGKFPLPGIKSLEINQPETITCTVRLNGKNKEITKTAESYSFKQEEQPVAAVVEPAKLAPLPVAPIREERREKPFERAVDKAVQVHKQEIEKECDLSMNKREHNTRAVDSKPATSKQTWFLYSLTRFDIRKYVKRARLDTKRASLLISYYLNRKAA